MAIDTQTMRRLEPLDIKQVPQEQAVRDEVRRVAVELAAAMDRACAPAREDLERQGRVLLERLALQTRYLGFAMVAVNNAFWQATFEGVPFSRRLLLLPKCLSDSTACVAPIDSIGLHCAGCGRCSIYTLKEKAEALGYEVIVAEGTSSVLTHIVEGQADALLGVACLDSLEKSFTRVVDLGIPNVAVPLLADGCLDTEAEAEEIFKLLLARGEAAASQTRTYVPLLREANRICSRESLPGLLASYVGPAAKDGDPLSATEEIALDWMEKGGKRLRPFVTVAAYAVARHGPGALAPHARVADLIPPAVHRLALAIETLHKASLVHDDIEDDDGYRYGIPCLHRTHGVGPALNVGDFLVGLGYRLVAGETGALGAECTADILSRLSAAHLELCRGQGAELLWKNGRANALRPADALAIYALKTAPAFEVALYAGLRAAGPVADIDLLGQFSTYLGEGYQVLNDLDDWDADDGNKVMLGQDVLACRPTILRAFALDAGASVALETLALDAADAASIVGAVRTLYEETGAFERAERLLQRMRDRALGIAEEVDLPVLRELLTFLVRVVLQRKMSLHKAVASDQ